MKFREQLARQASKGLTITERILDGDEVPSMQARTALAVIGNQIKHDSVENGRIARVISLMKIGVRDQDTRDRVARAALEALLPGATATAPVTGEDQAALASAATQG